MTDDLVGRLRAFCDHHGFGDGSSPALAAARIEALEGENERLREVLDSIAMHPGPVADDSCWWRVEEARSALTASAAARAALTPDAPHAD